MTIVRILVVAVAGMLIACGRSKPFVTDPAAAEGALRPFLDRAIQEFTHEFGSTGKRWEEPFVSQELFLLSGMEFYRARAFREGFSYDRADVTIPKPPVLRSFWLPIDPEGNYTYSVTDRTSNGDTVQLAVQFHCTVGTETHSDQNAIYHMVLERGAWRVAEITRSDGFSLKRFLTRERYMKG